VLKSAAGDDKKQAASQASNARVEKPKERAEKLATSSTSKPKPQDISSDSDAHRKAGLTQRNSSEE